jgi:hypothetical protein
MAALNKLAYGARNDQSPRLGLVGTNLSTSAAGKGIEIYTCDSRCALSDMVALHRGRPR